MVTDLINVSYDTLIPNDVGRSSDRRVPCGEHAGEPAWQEEPGEYRAMLRHVASTRITKQPAS